mmetsp:Transcript_64375/g.114437  ORF Transcript_64375/g.114437 Transcript_64375/m.114437 type:complete len:620 (-) Transcript_64375:7-1866(-)
MSNFSVCQREIFGYERRLKLGDGVTKQSIPPKTFSGDVGRDEIFYSPRRQRGAALAMPVQMLGGTLSQPDSLFAANGSPGKQSRGEIFGSDRRLRLGGTSALDEGRPGPAARRLRRARSSEAGSDAPQQTLGGHFDRKDMSVDEKSRHKEIFGGRRQLRSASPPSSICDSGPMPTANDSWQATPRNADFGRVDLFNTMRRKRGGEFTMANQMQGSITSASRHGEGDGGEPVKRGEIFGSGRRIRQAVEEVEEVDRYQSAGPRPGGEVQAAPVADLPRPPAIQTRDEGPGETPRETPRSPPRSPRRPADDGNSKVYQQKLFGGNRQSSSEVPHSPATFAGMMEALLTRPGHQRSSSADPRLQSSFEQAPAALAGSPRLQTPRMQMADGEDTGRARSRQVAALVSPRLGTRRLPRYRRMQPQPDSPRSTSTSGVWQKAVVEAGKGDNIAGSWCDRDAAAVANMKRYRTEPSWRAAIAALQQKHLTQEASDAIQNFDRDANAAERALEGHLQKEQHAKMANLERNAVLKQKFSPKLLELRASERALAKNRDYAQASVVKRQADAQERIERKQHAAEHQHRKAHLQASFARRERAAASKLQKGLYEELWRRALIGDVPVPPKV